MNIFCVKLGNKYPALLVNALFRMCKKNITTHFKFYCYTDDAAGLDDNITPIQYVDHDLDVVVFNKLFLFSRQFADLIPNNDYCVYFDIDIIIKSNIDHILLPASPELRVLEATWRPIQQKRLGPPIYPHDINSSCMMWSPPHTEHIWNSFMADPETAMMQFHWGMDCYLFYEHGIRGTLPRDCAYSHHYGIDSDLATPYANPETKVYNMLHVKHITDPIPIILMNGPTTMEDYTQYQSFNQV